MTESRRKLIQREQTLTEKLDARKSNSQKQAEYALAADDREPEIDDRPASELSASERQQRMVQRRANRTTWEPVRFDRDR